MEFDQEALIRSIAVSPSGKYMLLLGAGASASSGIPTAQQCVWEWKREIYLSGNPLISPDLFLDVALPSVQQRVQRWLDQQGKFPPVGDRTEYSFYIEYAYPKAEDRRMYFEKRFLGAIPEIGYQLLALLQNSSIFQWAWTTNFDGLVRQARKPNHTRPLKEIGLDTSFRLQDMKEADACAYLIYLHGDYRYDRLSNTTDETRKLDDALRRRLVEEIKRRPLIVIGYGANDESVMSALESAFQEKGNGGEIYWSVLRGGEIPSRLTALLEKAEANGYQAHIVEIEGFDDFMIRLARFICRQGEESKEVEALLSTAVPERSAFWLSGYQASENQIKSNGFPIELPLELYQFDVKGLTGWKELKEILQGTPVIAGLLKGKVLALGEPSKISETFDSQIQSTIERVPLDHRDFDRSGTVVGSILLQGFQQAVAHATNLRTKGKSILWDDGKHERRTYTGESYRVFEAVRLSLNRSKGFQFLNLIPDLHVVKEDGSEASREAIQDIKRQLLGKQWNQAYGEALATWCERLLGQDSTRRFAYPPGSVDGFGFKLSRPSACARILNRSKFPTRPSPKQPGDVFEAMVLEEPNLVFGSARGLLHGKDPHPIRGLLEHGPYDLQITQTGLLQEIRTGVICPIDYEQRLSQYLGRLTVAHQRVETKAEYLLGYPGFQQGYRIPLRVPLPTDREWRRLPGIRLSQQERISGQREIAQAINREIDALISLASVDVALIFIPQTWVSFETVEEETLRLDLHDFVKAYSAQRGVRTQFLREETLLKGHQCEVLWWLAQAIYVKSLRTPFVLDTDDPETVFVGIGYGYSRATLGSGVVLGCSHIYDAAGQGLRYRLSRIHNPIWRHQNPYLTKDDAIRVGLQARQLFYETYQKLPRRVVIHKRTPFVKSEREGFAQALKGVSELELLTIQLEDGWRFVGYDERRNQATPFPVKRGTTVITGPHDCLLWVHGAVPSFIQNNRSYYQGSSRIPVPLRMTRFAGHSPLERVATEILGLSKMDWNSYDLYSQMPATLESSGAIARIGQLLSRFGPETYDYRLFI